MHTVLDNNIGENTKRMGEAPLGVFAHKPSVLSALDSIKVEQGLQFWHGCSFSFFGLGISFCSLETIFGARVLNVAPLQQKGLARMKVRAGQLIAFVGYISMAKQTYCLTAQFLQSN